MKNIHPVVTATTSTPDDSSTVSKSNEPIIRLKLDKPLHWDWELTTSADSLPVIQLLDKDGRLLVETTGRTAQRARGSFRDGLKSHEEFKSEDITSTTSKEEQQRVTSSPPTTPTPPLHGNRNIDGFSTKFGTCEFGYKPRKSRSDVSVQRKGEKRGRKRHSTGLETVFKQNGDSDDRAPLKRYSTGDYLRKQILDDFNSKNTIGKTPEEIAKDRYRKVKAYLRSQSDSLPSLIKDNELHEETTKTEPGQSFLGNRLKPNELDEAFTEETDGKPTAERSAKSNSFKGKPGDIIKDKIQEEEDSKTKSKINEEELARIKAFLQQKIQQKMDEEFGRSRSSTRVDFRDRHESGIKKRHSECRNNDRRAYRARKVRSETNIVRFNPDDVGREESREFESKKSGQDGPTKLRRSKEFAEDSSGQQKNYRRTRSDVPIESSSLDRLKQPLKRTSSILEKRKLYRKTKSDVLLGQIGSSAENDLENPPRRIKSQDNIERSWREYKERKKQERLHRESEKDVIEEDCMSKPRWKDIQSNLCPKNSCKFCKNSGNYVDPIKNNQEKSRVVDNKINKNSIHPEESTENKANLNNRELNNSEANLIDPSAERPGTSLQENYLVVDQESGSPTVSSVAKKRMKNGGDLEEPLFQLNFPDCGYSSIPKKSSKDYPEFCTYSNVKKSDTFKIVDGSGDPEDLEDPDDSKEIPVDSQKMDSKYFNGSSLINKSNEDIARDYFNRVYELLKRRQEEARKIAEAQKVPGQDDSSSSNYVEEVYRKKHRKKKKEKDVQGEEIVAVPPSSGSQEAWKAQRLPLTNNDSPNNRRRGCRSQLLQSVPGGKRTRPSPPPEPSITRKINARDIDKYFDWRNKENTPRNAVNLSLPEEGKQEITQEAEDKSEETTMGSNLSRHNDKGLNGRRTQSSGDLCDPKGKFNSMGKILVPCSSSHKERYKFCGSLPNHLDGKDGLDDDSRENNNTMFETITGGLGGTLPHKKRSQGVHFSDSPIGTLDLVKHRSQDSLDENDPWRYQQSDLDLVRCRHGNFDTVRRNRSTDSVVEDGRGLSTEDGCHRDSELDLVGTLKRKQESRVTSKNQETTSSSSSSQHCAPDNTDDDLLMRIIHKPDCQLVKHRQYMNRSVADLKLGKLGGGEPQDQGYASERSPEDEHPPSLPGQPFPNITPESTFRVTLQKSSRGLGLSVSGGGTTGPVRVKRLFPQQPAALSNKLQPGDILLAANGIPLTGLTNYEALEVLRTTPSTVELVVCRLPGNSNVTPPGAPPPPPARREAPSSLRLLNPLPPLQIEPCGEFDIEMTKVGGSLGFTLRKADSSALGHYVRALVREPALSDGRIRPGDKIVAVDGAPLSPMSHEEAVALLRQCGPKVKLRLYRDLAQTPVSALSPTEPDHPLRPSRTSLRQEAVDMLCDLAVRKLSPGTSSGSSCKQSTGTSCNSPRRLRRLCTRTPSTGNDQDTPGKMQDAELASSQMETSDSEQCSIRTQITNSQANTPSTDIIDPPLLYDATDGDDDSSKSLSRPSFLDLSAPQDKPHFQFCSLESEQEFPNDELTVIVETDSSRVTEDNYDDNIPIPTSDEQDNNLPSEPASMPPVLSSPGVAAFSHKNPVYQSANPACGTGVDTETKGKVTHCSDQNIPGKILRAEDQGGSKGLLKWKGVMFAPNDKTEQSKEQDETGDGEDAVDSTDPCNEQEDNEVFMVELTRGWNSRLGFSLQPEGNHTVISVVYPDSVAAKDGRLKQGDVLLMVNDESVETMSTAEIIDLLRKIRGSIGITVMRRKRQENAT